VFFVGIGSAPNDFLMRRMSTIGRGAYTHVGTPEEVAAKMLPLLDILGHPAVQDLAVSVEGGALDLTPRTLPDIYAGQPLVLVGKTAHLAGTLTVSGTIGGRPWHQTLDLGRALDSPAVAKFWARRRIDDIEADRTLGKLEGDAADAAVTELGLSNGIVTSQTSLVAIDETPSRPAGAGLTREELPLNLPAGWNFDTLFGGASGQAAAHNAAAGDGGTAAQASELDLPQTATGFVGTIAQGLAVLLLGVAGLLLGRRRETV
jgi:Ca-activated chloride channel family protein